MLRSRVGVFIHLVQITKEETLFVNRCYSIISNDKDVATHRNIDYDDDDNNIIYFVPISSIRAQLHNKSKPK